MHNRADFTNSTKGASNLLDLSIEKELLPVTAYSAHNA